jgi:hypothetical protein
MSNVDGIHSDAEDILPYSSFLYRFRKRFNAWRFDLVIKSAEASLVMYSPFVESNLS